MFFTHFCVTILSKKFLNDVAIWQIKQYILGWLNSQKLGETNTYF